MPATVAVKPSMQFSTGALGLAVKTARERMKITAGDLAARTGITPSSLSRTEKGGRMLALDEAVNIAHVFGMNVLELMDLARALDQSGVVQQHDKARKDFQRAAESAAATVTSRVMRRGNGSPIQGTGPGTTSPAP